MKKSILTLTLTACSLLPIMGQTPAGADSLQNEIALLENALTNIQTDLLEKTLQYNWGMTEAYIEYCKKLPKITNGSEEPRLVQLATNIKPQELEPLRLAFEEVKKETDSLLMTYPEYVTLDSLYKRASNSKEKEDRKVALNNFYSRIYKEDKAYRPLLEKSRKAFKEQYIASVGYLLNECRKNRETGPEFWNYKAERIIKENNPKLQQLSVEISELERLQRETVRKYQRLKYHLGEE